ncbi:hypothetical protein KIP68_04680 [Corynebacterium aquatimens]|uniref:Outer membrane biosynthesis protein TonB n=1 Tax=Corynebacterium aquatimens TaxID=1190508 RepID=A0A931DY96_9CORY|nr:outer membrane biosynthesis protein TonB [Corynebacterium aquatimens]
MAVLTALALGAGLMNAPHADAADKTTAMDINLACGLRVQDTKAALGQAGGAEGTYNSGEKQFESFNFKLSATAPEEVKQGETFEYVVTPTKLAVPGSLSVSTAIGNINAVVNKVSQMNLWVDLPDPSVAEVTNVRTEGGDPNIRVERVGNRLHFYNPQNGSADLTKWSESNRKSWKHGGLEAKKTGAVYTVASPKIIVTAKAVGAPGASIAPSLNGSDPNKFPTDAFAQFYADAKALGFTIPAFIRCGYSDKDGKPENAKYRKASTPFPSVKIAKAADAPAPKPTSEQPAPKPTSEQPAPKPTSEQPAPKPTSEQPAPKPTSEQPAPVTSITTSNEPAPSTTTEETSTQEETSTPRPGLSSNEPGKNPFEGGLQSPVKEILLFVGGLLFGVLGAISVLSVIGKLRF